MNRTVSLARDSYGYYIGTLSLTGLPQGLLQITVFVKDALNNAQTLSQNFNFDSLPIVAVTAPTRRASFLQSKIHIKANVSDPGHSSCKGVVIYDNSRINFVNSIDTMVDILPQGTSFSGNIGVYGIDNESVSTGVNETSDITLIPIYIDKSPYLKPYFTSQGGQVIDFKDTRALVLDQGTDNIPHLKIVNITNGATENINIGGGAFVFGILCDAGAALLLNYSGDAVHDSVYVWKANKLTNVSKAVKTFSGISYGLISQGNKLMWQGWGNEIFLTDLTTFNTITAATVTTNNQNDFSPEGTIVYSKVYSASDYNIEKYTVSTGAVQKITTNGVDVYPSIDHNNIVYTQASVGGLGPYTVHLYNGSGDQVLGTVLENTKKYLLYNGYIAFSITDNSNTEQVWLRTSKNVSKQISFFSNNSAVDKLGNNGRMIFNSRGSRYYADSLTSAKRVQSSLGKVYFGNGDFYVAIGGSIYRYDIPSAIYPVKITSVSPLSAGTGATLTFKGSNFSSVTAVTLGGVAASSFKIASDTVLAAVVGAGASGAIKFTTAGGSYAISGFTYLAPTFTITGTAKTLNTIKGTPSASLTFNVSGTNMITGILVTPPAGFEVSKDNITFSTAVTIGKAGTITQTPIYIRLNANAAGTYGGPILLSSTGSVSQNLPVDGKVMFDLPATNFKITNTSATCRGSANGALNITAQQSFNYTALVTTNGGTSSNYSFTSTLDVNNLSAGTYNVCITIAGQADYQQCFTSVITEPKELSVYSSVITSTSQLVLSLDGGDVYHITLNGINSTTTAGQVTLNLKSGTNQLAVTTDKVCQGIISKTITIENEMTLFPNPFTNSVSLNLGDNVIKNASVKIYNNVTKVVYDKQYTNQSGIIQLDLSNLTQGVYIIELVADGNQGIHKIIKN
ncbi:T9SS type A sorting domain-containing protein [Mucilaginibacter xinganensis]|uniref:IPT/TIG domain-containing protein n=1 Tax=Mucilaginibacter xinganensis TaxID=1234841 RepID=A0A223NVD5_9SPHI|nr:T9SS type A sorting domain-containing protein [Mucilaginibacter xinganensis]ASU33730.1 IPT/TIG domain-containing protein [Mucilaginibacter xinganensis]